MAIHRPAFISSLVYRDPRAALKWLETAFGFELCELLVDGQDRIVHAEMSHGDGVIMIGSEWADWTASPLSANGKNTQRLHVRLKNGIDEHCERARRAGAKILMEPADQFYGDRTYMAVDPDGHHWSFGQPVREVSEEEMQRATGLKHVRK
jgi:uncharacterized glyoxalase superfamily protein PhnB